jgi:hypothetical protein
MLWWRRKAGGENVVELVSVKGVPNHKTLGSGVDAVRKEDPQFWFPIFFFSFPPLQRSDGQLCSYRLGSDSGVENLMQTNSSSDSNIEAG